MNIRDREFKVDDRVKIISRGNIPATVVGYTANESYWDYLVLFDESFKIETPLHGEDIEPIRAMVVSPYNVERL